jgi:hypothetical protein
MRHPRHLIDEISRIHGELSFKEAGMIALRNELTAMARNLEALDSERRQLAGELQARQEAQLDLEQRLRRDSDEHQLQARTSAEKWAKLEASLSAQLAELAKADQRHQDDLRVAEGRASVLENENRQLQDRLKQALAAASERELAQEEASKRLSNSEDLLRQQNLEVLDLRERLLSCSLGSEQAIEN